MCSVRGAVCSVGVVCSACVVACVAGGVVCSVCGVVCSAGGLVCSVRGAARSVGAVRVVLPLLDVVLAVPLVAPLVPAAVA